MSVINTALTFKDLPPPPPGKSGWPWTRQRRCISNRMFNRSNWPRISIITPSYNQGQFLEATIRSVLLQEYPNLEYIVIDGGSTDNSIEILKKYDPYLFYWHSKKDKGQADAINQGIEKSTGELLGWINSDDIYVKGGFYKIVKAFQTHPDHIVVHGDRILLNADGNVTGWSCHPPFNPKTLIYTVCSETLFWRRSAMEGVGLLNENLQFVMDLDFFGRLYNFGKFLKLNEFLGCLRCHSNSKSSTIDHVRREEAIEIWKYVFNSDKFIDKLPSKKKNFVYYMRFLPGLIKNPATVGVPYLWNRFFRRKFY